MSHDWFRSWHGAPTDPKWRTVARRAGVRPGDVTAVVWVLLDRASQASDRGSIAGYDAEVIADALGYEPAEVVAIIEALHAKDVLADNVFTGWQKHQPLREDGSAERGRAYREREKAKAQESDNKSTTSNEVDQTQTQPNATERNRPLDKMRLEEKEKERVSEPSVPRPVEARTAKGRKAYPKDFEEFWRAYPTDPNMSKAEALTAWQRISPEERQLCIKAVPPFVAWCREKPDYRPIHACRFIAKKRFEGHLGLTTTPEPTDPRPPPRLMTAEEIRAETIAMGMPLDEDHEPELSRGSNAVHEQPAARAGQDQGVHDPAGDAGSTVVAGVFRDQGHEGQSQSGRRTAGGFQTLHGALPVAARVRS